ncbi:MAG: hypothetical protein HA496_09885 [Thaumarchaeota archaeon]|jgi:hypothetical protein|nr:hypothetical protein [Nitrososphaerota archaeon]
MSSSKYAELIERIIRLCDEVIEKNIDPFVVDVKENLKRLREGLSEMDEKTLVMNMAALLKIIYVIALQQEDVKKRASRLYLDPFLMEVRLMSLDRERLAEAFLKAFRPIAENEQATLGLMRSAYGYWANLREYSLPGGGGAPETSRLSALAEILPMEEADLEREMERLLGEIGRETVDYYDFVGREGEDRKVFRALVLSFLMMRGLVGVVQDPLRNRVWIFRTSPKNVGKHSVALPI